MKIKNSDKIKKLTKLSGKKLRIIIALLVIVIAVGGFLLWKFHHVKTDTKAEKVVAQVTRGNINKIIEGSGTVEAISQYEITSLAKGDVIADYFEEGEYVEKDQLMYQIDSQSVSKNITKQQRSLEKARMNHNEAVKNAANLSIKSSSDGVISNLYISKGDTVQNGAKIADITNKDTLVVTLPFGKFDIDKIGVGYPAEVTLLKSLTVLGGSVTRISSGTYVNSYGVEVADVEIEFANPGSISEGESVTAVIGDIACYDSGKVNYINTKTITAKASGEVKSLFKMKGDKVSEGEIIAVLESDSVSRNTRDTQLSVEDAAVSLEELYDNLDDYSIRSPIAGKVIQKNIKAGEKLDSNSSAVMAIVADLSKLTFDMSIDELDISQISVGQTVSITADALPNRTFEGKVSNISIVGSAYQGVTSYPVTVTIDNTENGDLIPGMNVEAQIIVDSAQNVLRVPVSAVNMGNLVIVKDDGTFADPLDVSIQPASGGEKTQPENKEEQPGEKEKPLDAPMPTINRGEKTRPVNKAEKSGEEGKPLDAPMQTMNRGEKTQPEKKTEQSDTEEKTPDTKIPYGAKGDSEASDKLKSRMKSMIDNLDVPQGYTVVRVTTGLTDGTYIEIKEAEGSLKEGDSIILSAISTTTQNGAMNNGMPGMGGGMPGMGGGMPGMGGGMPGMGANRSGASGANGNRWGR